MWIIFLFLWINYPLRQLLRQGRAVYCMASQIMLTVDIIYWEKTTGRIISPAQKHIPFSHVRVCLSSWCRVALFRTGFAASTCWITNPYLNTLVAVFFASYKLCLWWQWKQGFNVKLLCSVVDFSIARKQQTVNMTSLEVNLISNGSISLSPEGFRWRCFPPLVDNIKLVQSFA